MAARMKVVSVVGARPQFVKLAPGRRGAAPRPVTSTSSCTPASTTTTACPTSSSADLGIPAPDVHLGIGSGSHGVQTGAMLSALDGVLERAPARLGARLRRHQLDPRRRARGGEAAPAGRAPRGRAALVQPARCRRSTTGCSPTTPPTCCSPRPQVAMRAPRGRGPRRPRRARRRRHDRRLPARPGRRAGGPPPGPLRAGRRPRGRRVPRRDHPPGREHRRPGPARRASSGRWPRCRCPSLLLAHPRLVARAAQAGIDLRTGACCTARAAGLPADWSAAVLGSARRGHRLRRPAEGGVPARGAVHDAAHRDRVDRDARRRLERAGRRPTTSWRTQRGSPRWCSGRGRRPPRGPVRGRQGGAAGDATPCRPR